MFLVLHVLGLQPVPQSTAVIEQPKRASEKGFRRDAGGGVAQVDAVEHEEVGVHIVEVVKDPADLSQPFLEEDFGTSKAPKATFCTTLNRATRLSTVSADQFSRRS